MIFLMSVNDIDKHMGVNCNHEYNSKILIEIVKGDKGGKISHTQICYVVSESPLH